MSPWGGINPNQIITDDFDEDGDVDLATAHVGQNTEIARFHGGVTVLLGNGNGTFQSARKIAGIFLNYSVASADLDHDGNRDLVATSYGLTGGCCIYGEVTVVMGNGDGTFGTPRSFRVGTGHTGPSAVASADLDRDGNTDLAVSNSATDDVSVMRGNGDGTFGTTQNFPAGDLPAFVISPDLNADSVADLAVVNQTSSNVSVLLNTTPLPPDTTPPITNHSLSPEPNAAGWNKSNVTVTLSAQDNRGGSGVKEIRYSATGAQSVPETVYDEQNPPLINTEGTTTISYFATDNAGNGESPAKTVTIKLDKSAPAAPLITSPANNSFDTDGTITLSGTAEAGSTVQLFEVTSSGTTSNPNYSRR